MTTVHVGMSIAGRSLAAARVLARSIRVLRPDWQISALVLPVPDPVQLTDDEPFEVIRLDYLDDAAVVRALNATPYRRQGRLAAPALVERLLDAGADYVLHVAPETLLVSEPIELEELLQSHDAVVVPRVRGPLPDDQERPDAADLQEAGDLDDGLFAVSNTAAGRRVAQWWADQARQTVVAYSIVESKGSSVPDRLVAAPLLTAIRGLAGVAVLDHPGYGVSVWNLHERPLERLDDGSLTAAGKLVRIMHFPDFRPDRPWWLATFATRTAVLDDPVLEPLCASYAAELRAAGYAAEEELDDQSRILLGNGLRYDRRLRRLHHKALLAGEDFGDIYTPAGAEAFTAWLTEPAVCGAAHGINRYAHDAWFGRPDLAVAYPNLDDRATADGFIGWTWVYGREELELQTALLPPRPSWVERTHSDPPTVLVTGYLTGVVGLGEAARGYVGALESAGVQVATNGLPTDPPETLSRRLRPRQETVPFATRELPGGGPAEIHLVCTNADQTTGAIATVPDSETPPYTIGLWAWETDLVPDRWASIYRLVDELWVYSTWIAENLALAAPVPTVVVPPPVAVPSAGGATVPFELPAAFTFLFSFDMFSTTARKNPVGLVKAFTEAFAPGEGPVLLLKTINATLRPEEHATVRHAAGGRDDVLIVDGVISQAEQAALFDACDCYVSLHRAEGFGMTIAEAMALGKPVITTAWSGNMDFTTSHNSYLVDYDLRAVGPDNPPYNPQGTWAEPSTDHAATLMRAVWENQEEARARGARGCSDVLGTLNTKTVGARARRRLERVVALRRKDGESLADSPARTADLEAALNYNSWAVSPAGARGIARRAVLRMMRPHTVPQYGLDAQLVQAVERMGSDLEQLREARLRDQKRLRLMERRLSERS